ncbi:MAG: hypothetical protein KDI17_01655 [Halioglobus sp.]|nr:hypothetical protein [Halioglobus sp.]
MPINRPTLKTLAEAGISIDIKDGLNHKAILELAEICASKGGAISISSKLLNKVSAGKLAELGSKNITVVYDEEMPVAKA